MSIPTSLRERRKRGTPVVALNLTVDPDAKAKIDLIADALGKSEGIIFDLIMEHVTVDADGRPSFWSGPTAAERKAQDEAEATEREAQRAAAEAAQGDLLAS